MTLCAERHHQAAGLERLDARQRELELFFGDLNRDGTVNAVEDLSSVTSDTAPDFPP
jgi:hypothetical protein